MSLFELCKEHIVDAVQDYKQEHNRIVRVRILLSLPFVFVVSLFGMVLDILLIPVWILGWIILGVVELIKWIRESGE